MNGESGALETLLRHLPECLNPGGRVGILTFHSGEDRRVKKAFEAGQRDGVYAEIAPAVVRAGREELRNNPRAASARLRWAVRGVGLIRLIEPGQLDGRRRSAVPTLAGMRRSEGGGAPSPLRRPSPYNKLAPCRTSRRAADFSSERV